MIFKKPIIRSNQIVLFIYLIPIALIIWFVSSFGVNVPFWDDWSLVKLFDKVDKGSVSFIDFFEQHNEHRISFPRVIFVILAFASKWNLKLEMYFSIFLAIISFYLLYKISEHSSQSKKIFFHLFNILSCFLFFSLVQHENWLWGFQIAWFLINTCLILAVFLLTVPQKISPKIRLIGAGLCCFIASFSSAHGLFSWLAVIPSVLAIEGYKKQKIFRLFFWLMFFGLSSLIYSLGYQKPAEHPNLYFFINNPIASLRYFLTILSSPIININASKIGILILFCFLFFNIYYLRKYGSRFAIYVTPWLSLGWFTILFTLITTIGRAGFGNVQAMSSRYTTISILLIISCIQMWRLFIEQENSWLEKKPVKVFVSYGVAAILVILLFSGYSNQIVQAKKSWLARNSSQYCLEVINFLGESFFIDNDKNYQSCLHTLHPKAKIVKNLSVIIERIGFRNFSKNIIFNSTPSEAYGAINIHSTPNQNTTLSRHSSLTITGWTTLPKHHQPPKLVLLSYGNNESFFTNANIFKFNKSNNRVKWQAQIYPQFLPFGETMLKAWLYDQDSKQFVKLKGEVKVKMVE